MYNPYIVGKRIYLRHPTLQDAEGRWHEWFSDEETMQWVPSQYWPNSIENQRAFYEKILVSRDRLVLSIVDIKTDKHIGVCNLSNINLQDRHAGIAVVIGEKDYRKGPYVLEAVSMLLKIAFTRLNLRILKGDYLSSNPATAALIELFHFKEVGRYPELTWQNGQYVDNIMVMLHRDDWLIRNKGK